MAVCKRIDYFRGGGAAGGGGGVEEMETEAASDLANRRACFSLMKKFTKEVYCGGMLGVHGSPLPRYTSLLHVMCTHCSLL